MCFLGNIKILSLVQAALVLGLLAGEVSAGYFGGLCSSQERLH